jgi:16S rRNA processing protein RimM
LNSESNRQRVVLAELHKPRGLRGELIGRSLTDIPGRFESLRQAHAHLTTGEDVPVELIEARPHKEDWLFKFAGVDSIEQANRFSGASIWVSANERAELPDGEFFESDLIGLQVVDVASGKPLGVVEDLQHFGGPPLLVLTYEGREVLIPFVPAICEVDPPAKLIRASLPEGLLEL